MGEMRNTPPRWNHIALYLAGLSLCYVGYQWFLQKLRAELEAHLSELERKKEKGKEIAQLPPESEARYPILKPRGQEVVGVWGARAWNA